MKLKCSICKEKYHNQPFSTCSKCNISVHDRCYGVDNSSSDNPWLKLIFMLIFILDLLNINISIHILML